MNYINELHNKHKDEPIWIVGSDPTLSDYPDNFLDDKLHIALHLAFMKFKRCTYAYANELDRVKFLLDMYPCYHDAIKIYGWPFYRRTVEESLPLLTGTVYIFNLTPFPPKGNIKDILNDTGWNALIDMAKGARDGTRVSFGDFGTCLHGAMFAAIMMGCSPINIIGCGMKTVGGKNHFNGAEEKDKIIRPGNPNFSDNAMAERIRGTEAIIEGARRVGITVNWYKTISEIPGQHS